MVKKSRKNIFGIISLVIGLLVGIAICELTLIGYFWIQDGAYLSVKEKLVREKNSFILEFARSEQGCSYIDMLMPHPYLGFVMYNNPCQKTKRFNRAGFLGPDFPLGKLNDKFVVLLAGGSVASQLVGLSGSPFNDFLTKRFGKIDGKEIIVLNGALGAWRQPQQAIIFLLYAEVIDAVITLDGYNENIAFNGWNRLEKPFAGNFSRVNPHLSLGYKNLLKGWVSHKLFFYSMNNWIISKSKLGYFLSLRLRNWVFDELEGNSQEKIPFDESEEKAARIKAFNEIFEFPKQIKAQERFQKNLQLYKKYISTINILSKQMGIKNLHFIQPVPPIGKDLTQEELNQVGDIRYGPRYQKLTDGLLELKKEGIPIFSLLHIFKEVKKSIYIDPIHCESQPINSKRFCYDMIADKIADKMEAEWGLKNDF